MEEAESAGSGEFPPKSFADTGAAFSSDELDHIPLTRRRIMLLAEKPNTPMFGIRFKEEEEDESLNPPVRIPDYSVNVTCNGSNDDVDSERKLDANFCTSPLSSTISERPRKIQVVNTDESRHSVTVKNETCDDEESDHLDHVVLSERQRMLLSRKLVGLEKPVLEEPVKGRANIHAIKESLPVKTQFDGMHENYTEVVPKSEKVNLPIDNDEIPVSSRNSTESSPCDANVPSLSATIKVKDETRDENCHNFYTNAMDNKFPSKSMLKPKSETSEHDEDDEDDADDMCLRDRVKLLRSVGTDQPNPSKKFEFSNKSMFYGINRLRKRKKTATDSVEAALQEDAPGLLQALVEKGVSLDEIRLYGETEDDEPIDESFGEDTCPELEYVTSKGFNQGPSFFKFAPVRSTSGEKPSYCLASLLSLVEQSRYLHFRKWPVEWGWCRDLQSFIFVFERHNRIVLERPEYGYATYFFELDTSTIEWQIKRLVTAMKLTIYSRVSLIENKSLSVGEDLSASEAKVLIRYGWVPNSGLGTMLNYRDRVVHDRINENNVSEWRLKIRKLLLDGYNGGTLVSTNVAEVKLEQEL